MDSTKDPKDDESKKTNQLSQLSNKKIAELIWLVNDSLQQIVVSAQALGDEGLQNLAGQAKIHINRHYRGIPDGSDSQ